MATTSRAATPITIAPTCRSPRIRRNRSRRGGPWPARVISPGACDPSVAHWGASQTPGPGATHLDHGVAASPSDLIGAAGGRFSTIRLRHSKQRSGLFDGVYYSQRGPWRLFATAAAGAYFTRLIE